jgi:putative flippase GtrA
MNNLVKKYQKQIKFSCSSIFSALIDLSLFTVMMKINLGDAYLKITITTIIARIASSIVNFIINKYWSFESSGRTTKEAIQYGILFVTKMLLSSLFVYLLRSIKINLTLLKSLVDIVLFFFSYLVQDKIIFKKTEN